MIKKILAFTLAEVLLVAGICSVIGALTIPNMRKSYEKKANLTKAKAVLYKLDSAMQQIDVQKTINGATTNEARSYAVLTEMNKYLPTRLSCGKNSTTTKCIAQSYSTGIDISMKSNVTSSNCSSALLKDGTSYSLCIVNASPTTYSGYSDYRGFILVDVDGPNKGTQVRGTDVFVFYMLGSGVMILPGSTEYTALK